MKFITFYILNSLLILLMIRRAQSVKYFRPINDICPQNEIIRLLPFRKDLELGNGVLSSITIEEKWNSSSFKRFNKCEFRVTSDTRKRKGLYAVIRKLDLRKDETTGECIDYIQLKYSNDKKSDQICGKIGSEHESLKHFDDPAGRFKIYIYIDKFMALDDISDNLEFSIVFTSYTNTDCDSIYNHRSCYPSGENGCIDKDLFHDGTVNCPPPYCWDEDFCLEVNSQEIVADNSEIILTAVISLVFTIIIVTSVFWLCIKSNSICCKSTRRQQRVRRPVRSDIELQTSPNIGHGISEPSAPPIDSHTVVQDKDQPPPYDSLFPER